jgi:hypothetical protein
LQRKLENESQSQSSIALIPRWKDGYLDPGIPSVMPVAGGCLTMKKECDAGLFLHDAWLFLLTLVTLSYFFYWS